MSRILSTDLQGKRGCLSTTTNAAINRYIRRATKSFIRAARPCVKIARQIKGGEIESIDSAHPSFLFLDKDTLLFGLCHSIVIDHEVSSHFQCHYLCIGFGVDLVSIRGAIKVVDWSYGVRRVVVNPVV